MTFEERIKELAFERGCGMFLTDTGEFSLKDQYELIKAASSKGLLSLPDDVEVWDVFEDTKPFNLLELINIEISSREHEYRQVAKWSRTPEDLCTSKMSREWLEENGYKLRSLDELKEILPGEMIECDVLHQSLLYLGYDAGYKNIMSNADGFSAVFYLDGEIIGTMDSFGMEVHTVRAWKPEML